MVYKNTFLPVTMTVSLFIFIVTAFLSFYNTGFLLDQMIAAWIEQNSNVSILKYMELLTTLGSSEFILVATLLISSYLLFKKDWFNSLFLLILTFGGILLNLILKISFQRERPGEMNNIEIFNYSIEIVSYSFPSGHTMRSVILFTFLIYCIYRLLKREALKIPLYTICLALILGVALSRIVLGAHFLSDTIAAISISLVWYCFCLYYLPIIYKKMQSEI